MRDSFGERGKALESDYVQKKELELIEKLKQRAEEFAKRKGLAEAVGLENAEILDILREMGFDRDTVVLLFLVPVLQVAWIDGNVSASEREGILEIARLRNVAEGSPAHQRLVGWLDKRPEDDVFERALPIIRALLSYQREENRETLANDLKDACAKIASASGGILGFGAISGQEQAVIERVTAEIQKAHEDAAKKIVGKL